MTKKRVFISCHYMEIGGAEMSLIGLLKAFDYKSYDVDLFLQSHQGELMKYIPEEVNLLPEIPEYAQVEKPIKEVVRNGFYAIAAARIAAKLFGKLFLSNKNGSEDIYGIIAKLVTPFLPSMNHLGEYDLAINYIGIGDIVTKKVLSKKKLGWIHTDYSTVKINTKKSLRGWNRYDHILSISSAVTEAFLKKFPSLKPKIVEMENIMSAKFVRERAEEYDARSEFAKFEMSMMRDTCLNILSIGRFTHAKNYDNVPDICKRLSYQLSIVNSQLCVRWFLIGYGGDEQLIREKIAESGMEDNVIILGKRTNPYPYIKACDIYVQPSRYEGKSITVREAQILCKPVVVTNYLTAKSQINDRVDGVLVPMDNEGCANGIAEFIQDLDLRNNIIGYLQHHDYACSEQISKLYELI